MKKEFNLKEKRMEYYRRLCKELPDIKWALLFDVIKQQDQEFIKILKEEWKSTYWFKTIEEDLNKFGGYDLNKKNSGWSEFFRKTANVK